MKKTQLRKIIKEEIQSLLKEEPGWEEAHALIFKDLEDHMAPAFIVDREFLRTNIELMLKHNRVPQELIGAVKAELNDDEGLDMIIDAYKKQGKY